MQILEVDVGNTCAKWRMLDTNAVVLSRGYVNGYAWSELTSHIEAADHMRIASVANKGLEDFVITAYPNKSLYVAHSMLQTGALRNAYKDYKKLGVDRWLAVVAAYQIAQRGCYVFDCGSAVTLDVVANDGQHQGGFIVPGLQMLQNSLLNNTAAITFDPLSIDAYSPEHIDLGRSTQEAVVHGSYFLLRAWIQRYLAKAQAEGAEVFFTGGDAALLMKDLCAQNRYFSELVLDGLSTLEHAAAKENQ